MISDEFINYVSTVPFLSKIKRGEVISGVSLHEEYFTADHGDELRSDDV